MNLIVGINGAGKTSVLESAAILLSWLLAKLNAPGSIEPSDSADLKAVKTIDVFNLNEKSLKHSGDFDPHRTSSEIRSKIARNVVFLC